MIYLIGGGSGAGKTTTSKTLAKRYGLNHIKMDVFGDDHQSKASPVQQPVSHSVSQLNKEEQPLHLLELDGPHELARQSELFFMFLGELSNLDTDNCVIEGNGLRPELVTKYFTLDYRAVWLIPTDDFLRENGPKRSWLPDILTRSLNPDQTLERWIQRNIEYNDYTRRQAERHKVSYLDIDGEKDINKVVEWATKEFQL